MNNKERLHQLTEYLDQIKKYDFLVVVEGKKDKIALERVGIQRIKTLNGPLYKVVEEVQEEKTIVLLVDLDAEGKKLYRVLKHDLKHIGVAISDKLRSFLFRRTPLRQIEGLDTYMETLRNKKNK